MQVDIPAHIEKLLFLHDSLVIPGFGGFTATIASAKADFAGGTVTPPSKILTFSENLAVDDGRLVQDIAVTHGISTEDARTVVAGFVEKMQNLLNQREIVTLPNIGRLYKNYMQKIQFLPDATNFNASAYGLPPLQFSPLGRSREVPENTPTPSTPTPTTTTPPAASNVVVPPPAPTPAPRTEAIADSLPTAPPPVSPPAPQVISTTSSRIFPYVAGVLLLVAIGLGFWRWNQLKQRAARSEQEDMEQSVNSAMKRQTPADTEPERKINEKPTSKPVTPEREPEPAEALPKPKQESPKASTAKTSRECILIAATLSDDKNAERLIQKLKNNGFDVYSTYKGGHQIGIRFKYTDPAEIDAKSRALQQITKERPVVKKR